MNALSLILDSLAPLAGRSILDIGCGAGTLAKALAGHGAIVTGVDPNPEALAAARAAVTGATFVIGSAEALPVPDASQDGAGMLNSLHHVPSPAVALREAARVLRPGCSLVVVEPVAAGSSFEVLRPVDDETAVRAAAQDAIAAAVTEGAFICVRDIGFERLERFADLEGLLARIVAVDPARASAIAARRPEIETIFARVAEREPDGRFVLRQPLHAHVLVSGRGPA